MLPTARRQEEEAAEAGSLLSLQAVTAAAAQPLPGAAGEPLRPNPTLEWQTVLERIRSKLCLRSVQCPLLETAPCDALWGCALGAEGAGRQRPEAWQWHLPPCLPVFWGSQGRVWTG